MAGFSVGAGIEALDYRRSSSRRYAVLEAGPVVCRSRLVSPCVGIQAGGPVSRPWFRMYSEFVSDPKVQLLAFEDQRHFVALLCLKCNDTLDSEAPAPGLRDRMIAKALGLSVDAAIEAKRRLIEVGLISDEWHPIRWESRQYEHDVSTSRVKAYRERQASMKQDETFQERPETVSGTTEIQIRTDTDQNKKAAPVVGLDPAAWEQWETYRREIRKPLKPASIPAAQRKLAAFGKDQSAVVEHSVANGYTGLFRPDPKAQPKSQERRFQC